MSIAINEDTVVISDNADESIVLVENANNQDSHTTMINRQLVM